MSSRILFRASATIKSLQLIQRTHHHQIPTITSSPLFSPSIHSPDSALLKSSRVSALLPTIRPFFTFGKDNKGKEDAAKTQESEEIQELTDAETSAKANVEEEEPTVPFMESAAGTTSEEAAQKEGKNSPGPAKKTKSPRKKKGDLLINERVFRRALTEDEAAEAEEIGYQIDGPARAKESPWGQGLVFAVVQVGSHQFKVSGGDLIYVEKLTYADVNQKIILNKVLLLGTKTQTIIGRPLLPRARVIAVVEQQALNAEVIVFKKKRRKNYRRCKTHQQALTRLRIIGVEGVAKYKDSVAV